MLPNNTSILYLKYIHSMENFNIIPPSPPKGEQMTINHLHTLGKILWLTKCHVIFIHFIPIFVE